MGKPRSFFSRGRKVQTVDRLVLEQQAAGFALQNAGSPDGSTWVVDGRELRNFGSCSYMGLARHPALEAVPAFDTAGAVRDVVAAGARDAAAIAGARAARLYGGVVLASAIQDADDNLTRFVKLGRAKKTTAGLA